MEMIMIFAALLGGFLIIGTICAIAENGKDRREGEPEDEALPRVVIS